MIKLGLALLPVFFLVLFSCQTAVPSSGDSSSSASAASSVTNSSSVSSDASSSTASSSSSSVSSEPPANYYVNVSTGVDDLSHGTFSAPCKTITYAVNTLIGSATGKTVYVEAGTYGTNSGEAFVLNLTANTTVYGDPVNTIIIGDGIFGNIFNINTAGVVISNLTISNSTSICPFYVNNASANPVIDHITVRTVGDSVDIVTGSALVKNSTFIVSGSSATAINILGASTFITISNCTISGTVQTPVIFEGNGGGGTIIDCTITTSATSSSYAAILLYNTSITLQNTSVIADGGGPDGRTFRAFLSTEVVTNNGGNTLSPSGSSNIIGTITFINNGLPSLP